MNIVEINNRFTIQNISLYQLCVISLALSSMNNVSPSLKANAKAINQIIDDAVSFTTASKP